MHDYDIDITPTNTEPPYRFRVTVTDGATTAHTVTLSHQYMQQLGADDPETLVRSAFEFLLARESNTAIRSSFDLQDTEQYFSDFPNAMREQFR